MSYKTLIKNWHAKATEEDYFSKFVFEYLAFIAFLKTQKYSSSNTDRAAIQKLKQDSVAMDRYLQCVNSKDSLKADWEHVKKELDKVRLGNVSRDLSDVEEIAYWNCNHDHLNQMTDEEKLKTKGIIHSLQDWGNMVEFWHAIRNNLFHGAKNPENKRDQFAVKYGYRTLRVLMENFLDE